MIDRLSPTTVRRLGTVLAVLSLLGCIALGAWGWRALSDQKARGEARSARIAQLEAQGKDLAVDLARQRAQFERCKKLPPGSDGCSAPVAPAPNVEAGAPGKDGRGIASTSVGADGVLRVVYTDGVVQPVGTVRGATGPAGKAGAKGDTGATGKTGAQGPEGDAGATGAQGETGATGPAGKDGEPGPPGRGIESLNITDTGHLAVTYTDGGTADLGLVVGPPGKAGVGVDSLTCDSQAPFAITFQLTLTDGTTQQFTCGGKIP